MLGFHLPEAVASAVDVHNMAVVNSRSRIAVARIPSAASMSGHGEEQLHDINYTAYFLVSAPVTPGCQPANGSLSNGKSQLFLEDQALVRHAVPWSRSIKTGVVTWGLQVPR